MCIGYRGIETEIIYAIERNYVSTVGLDEVNLFLSKHDLSLFIFLFSICFIINNAKLVVLSRSLNWLSNRTRFAILKL
jgi:hypothetical protein